MTTEYECQTLKSLELLRLFKTRPARSTNCTNCSGRGHIDRPYVLEYTPMLVGAPPASVTATVLGTASIFEATQEASEIANRARCAVAFYFMHRLVVAKPYDDPGQIARRWWQEFYGKSYEESVNDR